jgi:ABC-2 type transport system ATP-binding protein
MNTAEALPLVDVHGLGKRYAGRDIVTGVTLTLRAGTIVGLVGANGGGKTTTIRMLAGLLRPDAGGGMVLGEDVCRSNRRSTAKIGYMPQRLGLYPDLTVSENLWFRADMHGIDHHATAIADAIARFGIAPFADRRCEQLSGGWGRRVQFAATVLHRPTLLLLDEPTAGLDVATRRDIWRWLGESAADGHGVVIATHDLVDAAHCSSILFYDQGVADGPMTPAALIARSGADSLEAAVVALAGVAER